MTATAHNTLTADEVKDGWVLLFNGRDLTGWHRVEEGYGGWQAVEGAICLTERGGYLWTDELYDNFILRAEYKLDPEVNSGIFFRVADPTDPVQTGFEIQVLDDAGRPLDTHSNGALYDCVAPCEQRIRPTGEWNQCVVTADDKLLSVEMNGAEIVRADLTRWTEAGRNPDGSPNKFHRPLCEFPSRGHIGLQDHGGRVWYRNLKLKQL